MLARTGSSGESRDWPGLNRTTAGGSAAGLRAGGSLSAPSLPETLIDARTHWRKTLTLTLSLLGLWAVAGIGCGILFADALNGVTILGAIPLGFWFAQQGSILVFVVIVFAYAVLMNRLDAQWRKANPRTAGRNPVPPPRSADSPPPPEDSVARDPEGGAA